jgi:hypothetical protein
MKKHFFALIILLFAATAFSQQNNASAFAVNGNSHFLNGKYKSFCKKQGIYIAGVPGKDRFLIKTGLNTKLFITDLLMLTVSLPVFYSTNSLPDPSSINQKTKLLEIHKVTLAKPDICLETCLMGLVQIGFRVSYMHLSTGNSTDRNMFGKGRYVFDVSFFPNKS